MTKEELIVEVAKRTGTSKKETKETVNTVLDVIRDELASGEDARINLSGFGIFDNVRRVARKGRNPATGESMDIPACTVPRFHAAAPLKHAVKAGC